MAKQLDSILPELYARLMYNGTPTRFDVAADFSYLSIDETLFHLPNVAISEVRTKSGHTVKLGGDSSARHFTIYNKRAECKAKKKMQPLWIFKIDPSIPVGRIEVGLKPKQKTLSGILSMPNPMAALQVASYAGLSNGDDAWAHFLDAVRFGGGPYALLKMTDKTQRALYAQRIAAGGAWWWNPNRVSEYVPDQIAELFAPTKLKQAA